MNRLPACSFAATLTDRRDKRVIRAVSWHFLVFAWLLAIFTASPLRAQASAVPGTVEAENFTAMSGVQTEACSEGGLNVGWIDGGDWMDYAINPSSAGAYMVELRVASFNGGTVRVMSGSTELATLTIPGTGGWQNWSTVSGTLNLAAGNQTIRLDVVSGQWNINWTRFSSLSGMAFPSGTGMTNVRDYGAVGDGVTDDTQAIRNAINAGSAGVARVVYLPDGTYKVSDTISWTTPYERYLTLQGQSKNGTVIKLVDNAAAYQSAASPKAVLSTLRSSSNLFDSFRNYIRNLTVDVGQGNAGAVGIDYLSNNIGGIYDVIIRSSDPAFTGYCGLRMPMAGPGPSFVKNVQIIGFDTGIWATDTHVCVTFEHINLSNQRTLAICNDKNSLTFLDLVSQNSVPVVSNPDERGFVQIISGTFSGGLASSTAITSPLGMVHLRDVAVSGYGNAISDRNGILPSGTITEYVTNGFRSATSPAVKGSLRLPISETPDVAWDAPSDWVFITAYGCVSGDSKQPYAGNWSDAGDDSGAIQAAIDSGKTTVCFPNGVWTINNTIHIRGNVRRIIGMDCSLQAGATLANSGAPMFSFEDGTSPTVVFERFDSDYGGISGPFIQHNSSRTLVLKAVGALGSPYPGYYNYQTGTGTGDLYVEDSIIRISIRNQRAWMRQYNSETVSLDQITPHLINDGGTVFVLGMKTEGNATQIETKNGGQTEVLGGLLASTNYIQPDLPGIINNESKVCVVAPTYIDPAAQQELVVSETIGGVNRTLKKWNFPTRSSSEYQWWTGTNAPSGNFYAYQGGYVALVSGQYLANTWQGDTDSNFNSGSNYVRNAYTQWTDYVFDSNAVNPSMNVNDFTGWGNISLNSGLATDIVIQAADPASHPVIMAPFVSWGGSVPSLGGTIEIASDSKNLTINTNYLAVNEQVWNIGTGRTLTINGAFQDWAGQANVASLNKQGAGTATLTGSNSYSGGTTINGGTLRANRSTLGSGAVVINSGGTLYANDQWVLCGANPYNVAERNIGTLTINAGGTLQFDDVQGFANCATNLYLNGGLVTGGPNNFRGDLCLYNGNEQITAGGATTSTIATVIGVTGNNNTITVDGGSTLNISSVVKNSDWSNSGNPTPGGFIKAGGGTLNLSAANSYTGDTAINAGKIILTGSLNNTSSASIATGAELAISGTLAASGNIVNNGTLVLTGAAQLSAGGTITNNGTLINSAPGYTLPANLVNNGTIYNLPAAPVGLSATAGDAQVALSWSAVSGASSYRLKQSAFPGGPYTTIATPTGTNHTATGLTNGTTYYFVVTAINTAGESANSAQASAKPQVPLPLPRLTMDIGNVGLTGSAVFSGGTYTLQGAGTGITGTADTCRFVYQTASGDCSATIRVQSLSTTGSGTKVGVMIRESLAANAREAGVWVSPANGLLFTRRTSTGGTTAVTASTGKTAPYWVRLTRTGTTFRAFYSPDGSSWTQFGSNRTISMATTTYIGIATTSGTTATLCTGVMTGESVTP